MLIGTRQFSKFGRLKNALLEKNAILGNRLFCPKSFILMVDEITEQCYKQGTLTEGKDSVQLTSILMQVVFIKMKL